MKVLGQPVLERFIKRHADANGEVLAWLREAERADWSSFTDVRARYVDASYISGHVIFNIRRNRYRLDTQIAYATRTVVILRIGTHAEYDRWTFD